MHHILCCWELRSNALSVLRKNFMRIKCVKRRIMFWLTNIMLGGGTWHSVFIAGQTPAAPDGRACCSEGRHEAQARGEGRQSHVVDAANAIAPTVSYSDYSWN